MHFSIDDIFFPDVFFNKIDNGDADDMLELVQLGEILLIPCDLLLDSGMKEVTNVFREINR